MQLEELYRQRDAEIRDLARDLSFGKKTKIELATRRDTAYEDLGDLFAQRSLWLNFVSDNMRSQQQQNSFVQEINQKRLDTNEELSQSVQIMSTRVMEYDLGTLTKGKNPNQQMVCKINDLKTAQK